MTRQKGRDKDRGAINGTFQEQSRATQPDGFSQECMSGDILRVQKEALQGGEGHFQREGPLTEAAANMGVNLNDGVGTGAEPHLRAKVRVHAKSPL